MRVFGNVQSVTNILQTSWFTYTILRIVTKMRTPNQKLMYLQRKQQGLCTTCSNPNTVEAGYTICTICREKQRIKYHKNPTPNIENVRKRTFLIKKTCFEKYGSHCIQCGETRLGCLELDHIEGGGSDHRETLNIPRSGGGIRFYNHLLKEGKFPNTIQILCANCHALKHCKYMSLEAGV